MTSGSSNFNTFPENQLTTFRSAVTEVPVYCLKLFSEVPVRSTGAYWHTLSPDKAALLHDQIINRRLDARFCQKHGLPVTAPAAITEDIVPLHYAIHPQINVSRQWRSADGPSRDGGLAVVFCQSFVVRRHPLSDSH